MSRVRLVTVVLGVCGAIGVGGTFSADDLPSRAPGLWELVKNVVDDPRPLPAMRQCTDAATDRMLGGNIGDLLAVRQYLDARRGGWA